MDRKKLGLGNVVSISVGLVIATSCLVSLGNGAGTLGVTFILAMAIAMLLNMTTVASLSELNALMPNTTGGLAQYTLAAMGPFPTLISMVGGYIICNTMSCGVEASIFSFLLSLLSYRSPFLSALHSGRECRSYHPAQSFQVPKPISVPFFHSSSGIISFQKNSHFLQCSVIF